MEHRCLVRRFWRKTWNGHCIRNLETFHHLVAVNRFKSFRKEFVIFCFLWLFRCYTYNFFSYSNYILIKMFNFFVWQVLCTFVFFCSCMHMCIFVTWYFQVLCFTVGEIFSSKWLCSILCEIDCNFWSTLNYELYKLSFYSTHCSKFSWEQCLALL